MESATAGFLQTLLISLNTSLSWSGGNSSANTTTGQSNETTTVDPPSWPAYLPIYVTILNMAVFFTGTLGNVLVVVVVVLVRDMRTPMNWYLVNLSLADLLVLLVCQPAALTEFFARDRWLLGAVLCKMVPFLEHASLHASTLIILSITVERYYAICRPLKKLSVCHKPNPLRVMPCVWSTAVLTSVPFIIMTRLERTKFFDGTPCDVCATSVNHIWHYAYIIATFVSFFALPMLLLICLYFKIILCLRTSGTALRARQTEDVASMSTRRSRKQVVKMLVGIVVLFFISLMPVRCVIIWQIFTSDAQIQGLGPEGYYNLMWISRLLMYINSAGNPIIYSLVSSKFQEAFWRLLTGRRGEPLTGSPRGSVSTRHTSIGSRWSLTGLHRNSLSHGAGMMRNGQADRGTSVALHRIQTTSVCGWVSLQSSQGSSTFIKKEMKFSLPKQQSCASIL